MEAEQASSGRPAPSSQQQARASSQPAPGKSGTRSGTELFQRRSPDRWKKGCVASTTIWAAPRWTMSRDGMHTRAEVSTSPHQHPKKDKRAPRHRDTWIQHHMRSSWTPGPGSYRSEREFLIDTKDELDTNLTVQECAANYSFPRVEKAGDAKPQKNHGLYPKFTNHWTPGPGSYMHYTVFGSPSGGHRHQYFGGHPSTVWSKISTETWGTAPAED